MVFYSTFEREQWADGIYREPSSKPFVRVIAHRLSLYVFRLDILLVFG